MKTTEVLGYLALGAAGAFGYQAFDSYRSMQTWNKARAQKQLSASTEADLQGVEHQALLNAQLGYESALKGVEQGALGAGLALVGSLWLFRS